MKFVWEDDVEIGYYLCKLLNDDGKCIDEIHFRDYTCQFQKEQRYRRPYSFEVGYCSGWSMGHGFDYDDKYNSHKEYGYNGNCTHTVNDIKHWCEEFIANLYIFNVEEAQKKLEERKKKMQWFLNNGYTGEYEDKE